MSQIPENLHYTKTHEWVRVEADGTLTVGVTDHAQHLLGDLVFVELPKLNAQKSAGQECCVLESVKAAADVYMPVTGKITEVNGALESVPETINHSAYVDGWIFKMMPDDKNAVNQLLNASQYADVAKE